MMVLLVNIYNYIGYSFSRRFYPNRQYKRSIEAVKLQRYASAIPSQCVTANTLSLNQRQIGDVIKKKEVIDFVSFYVMQRPAKGDDIFRPIIIDGVVVRDKKYLQRLGKVLKLQWLHGKSVEIRKSLIDRIVPSFACRAVENNDFISLRVLLEKMDASCETYDQFTPLHTACELGNLEMINFLLSKGASPHHKNRFGNCPMYMAIKNRQCHAVKLLSLKGVTVRLQTVRIAMEMIQAVQNRDYPLLRAWFLSGVDMDAKDYNERTVMHEAVYLGDKSMICRLLGYGATPLERDVWGQTAMDNAQNDTTIMALFEPFFTMRCPTKQAYLLFKAEHSHT